MARSLRWIIAGTLVGALPTLAACSTPAPQTPEPKPRPFEATQEPAYQARDYYFPSSGNMRAVYSLSESVQMPSPQQSYQSTGSITVVVTSYSPTQAVVQATSVGTGQNGQPTSDVTTTTLRVESDGTVVATDGTTQRHSNAVFTPLGATVTPASGSEIPEIRARLIGTEAVTVPAGSYQTVHIQEGPAGGQGTPTDLWLARGVGIVRQQLNSSFPVRTGDNQTAQAQGRFEIRLESFTP